LRTWLGEEFKLGDLLGFQEISASHQPVVNNNLMSMYWGSIDDVRIRGWIVWLQGQQRKRKEWQELPVTTVQVQVQAQR
jgi:hypothetical protein